LGDSLKIGKTVATAAKATGIVAKAAESPKTDSSLALVPPAPVAVVEEPQATGSIKLDAATLAKLDRLVAAYVIDIAKLDTTDPEFESRVADIRTLGNEDMKA